MKNGKLIFEYYRGGVKSIIFMTVVFTVLLLYMVLQVGSSSGILSSIELYEGANLENSLYYMPATDLYTEESDIGLEKLHSFPAVKDVVYERHTITKILTYEIGAVNAIFYSDAMLDAFSPALQGLSSFSDEEGGILQGVVCGMIFAQVKPGEILEMIIAESPQPLRFQVIGNLGSSVGLSNFGTSASDVNTEDLFSRTENSVLFREKDLMKWGGVETRPTYGCFIRLNEQASAAETQALKDYLANTGGYATYAELLARSADSKDDQLRYSLALPVLFLGVALLAYVAIFVLLINRKTIEMRAYFLCGYSKKKAYLHFFLSMLLVILVPCLLCTFFVPVGSTMGNNLVLRFAWMQSIDGLYKVIPASSLWFVAAYFVLCLGLALLISIQFIRKSSAIELSKREI